MAVIALVAALFCQGTLEFWILLTGASGMVKFLYGKSIVTYEGTTIIQETKVVVLDPCLNRLSRMVQIAIKVC